MFSFFRRQSTPVGQGWQPISSAPRDGTIIEICCTFGVAPWYGLYKWEGGEQCSNQNQSLAHGLAGMQGSPGRQGRDWVDVRDPLKSVTDGDYLQWRPTNATAESYVDPTHGAQETTEYWLQACKRR